MITLKELSIKRREIMSNRYPLMPAYAIPNKNYSEKDANSLTDAIIDCIDYLGGWASRISTEGRYIEALGKRIPSSVKRGTADIHSVINGKHYSIEIKMPGDRLSDHQIKVKQDIEQAGGVYLIVSCWKDFVVFFESINKDSI